MKPAIAFVVLPVLLLSCTRDSSNPVSQPVQSVSSSIVFGQEKQQGSIQFVSFPYQDTTNLQYLSLGDLSNLGIRVNEQGSTIDFASLDKAKIIVHLFTSSDQEGFEVDVNCRLFASGVSADHNGASSWFEMIVPAAVRESTASNNDTLEFTGKSNDFIFLRYVSPFSGMTVLDTVVVTQHI